jgi:hypothetical protein
MQLWEPPDIGSSPISMLHEKGCIRPQFLPNVLRHFTGSRQQVGIGRNGVGDSVAKPWYATSVWTFQRDICCDLIRHKRADANQIRTIWSLNHIHHHPVDRRV